MDWATWRPFYDGITHDFGYDREADATARDVLREMLAERMWAAPPESLRRGTRARDAFRRRMQGQEVWVVGAAATEHDIALMPDTARVLVTDGAAAVTLAHFPSPDAIVTDLDGDVEAQRDANARGVPLFLHAHGDNVETLREWVPKLEGVVFGTTQVGPLPPVWNHGGFTDGDRACCIAEAFGAGALVLVGFDFDVPVAKAGVDVDTKRRKLAWARRIVESLPIPVRYATSERIQPK